MKSRVLKKTLSLLVSQQGMEFRVFTDKMPRFRRRRDLVAYVRRGINEELDYLENAFYGVGHLGTAGEVGVMP